MRWTISIFTQDRKTLVFAAQCSREECAELAAEARRQRPDAVIFCRAPAGAVTEWP